MRYTFTDPDGDAVRFDLNDGEAPFVVQTEGKSGVYLSDDNLRALRKAIDEHLDDAPKEQGVALGPWKPGPLMLAPPCPPSPHERALDVALSLAETFAALLHKEHVA